MKYHSQNNETEIALKYFGIFKGTVLDIGANDGITFSNSFDMILNGWKGVLVEPSQQCENIIKLWDNPAFDVRIYQVGIGKNHERKTLFESGAHVPHGNDKALVSTFIPEETDRWRKQGVQFDEMTIEIASFDWLYKICNGVDFDYISLDVEGMEMEILEQIDLTAVGCKMICIEWNSIETNLINFTKHISKFGLKEIHRNAENLIFAL